MNATDTRPKESSTIRAALNEKPYNPKFEGEIDTFADWLQGVLDSHCDHPLNHLVGTETNIICTRCNKIVK